MTVTWKLDQIIFNTTWTNSKKTFSKIISHKKDMDSYISNFKFLYSTDVGFLKITSN